MKTILKSIFYVLALPLLVVGCSENEEPELEGFPKNSIGLFVAGAGDSESTVTYEVEYNQEGKLEVSSDPELEVETLFSQTFEIKAACASPEPMIVKLEPYLFNIPADQVEISSREVTIDPGYNSATVTVQYVGQDYSFIESMLDAQKFELGVRILEVNGYQVENWTPEAKVVADKVAYESLLAVDGAQGREITVNRTYKAGAIVEEPVTYTFQVKLNRPAFSDVVVDFETLSLDAQFADDATFAPSKVTIPAGSLVSEEVTWTLANDFLLTTDWIEFHDLEIKPTCQTDDPRVLVSEEEGSISVHVAKGVQAFDFIEQLEDSWSKLDGESWAVEQFGSSCVIDMIENQNVAGFGLTYGANTWGGGWSAPGCVTIYISEDGISWTAIGTVDGLKSAETHYFKMDKERSLRYLKFVLSKPISWWTDLKTVDVYGPKE